MDCKENMNVLGETSTNSSDRLNDKIDGHDEIKFKEEDQTNFNGSDISELDALENKNINEKANSSISHVGAPDDDFMYVVRSGVRKTKRNFCYYCHTMQSVISRHLVVAHKNEAEVREIISLEKYPENTILRRKLIGKIRLAGDNLFNSSTAYNDGELLVSRQLRKNSKRTAKDYKLCHGCNGWFIKINIHRRNCLGQSSLHHRNNPTLSGRLAGRFHEDTSILLQKVLSVMRDDDVTRLIRYDKLLIRFGNDLTCKYHKQQQHDVIRSRLRLCGKLLRALKQINSAVYVDFSSIFFIERYKDIIKAIREISGYNAEKHAVDAPSIITTLGTFLTKIGRSYRSQCAEDREYERKKEINEFLEYHDDRYPILMNNLAYESQTRVKRPKKILLPTSADIKKFQSYLEEKLVGAYDDLKIQFSVSTFLALTQATLVLVLLFNRNHPSELERVTITDYENSSRYSESNAESYAALTEEQKKLADKYIRFGIGGKLNCDVPVILSIEMQEDIQLILDHRTKANIYPDNPFIFALPGYDGGCFKHLKACELMRTFAKACGADHPERLRCTLLRKHLATTVASLKIAESQIYDISNFMEHAKTIHRKHYRQSIMTRDIFDVSKISETVLGNESNTAVINPRSLILKIIPHDNDCPKFTKKRWTEIELKLVQNTFKKNIDLKILPKTQEIRMFLKNNPQIERTVDQVRSWVNNQYVRKN